MSQIMDLGAYGLQRIISQLPDGKSRMTIGEYKAALPKGVRLIEVNGKRNLPNDAWIGVNNDVWLDFDEIEGVDLIDEVEKRRLI